MHHRFPIKLVPTLDWVDFGNDEVNEIQSVNRAMKDAQPLYPNRKNDYLYSEFFTYYLHIFISPVYLEQINIDFFSLLS